MERVTGCSDEQQHSGHEKRTVSLPTGLLPSSSSLRSLRLVISSSLVVLSLSVFLRVHSSRLTVSLLAEWTAVGSTGRANGSLRTGSEKSSRSLRSPLDRPQRRAVTHTSSADKHIRGGKGSAIGQTRRADDSGGDEAGSAAPHQTVAAGRSESHGRPLWLTSD